MTDEIRVTIAGNACILLLHRDAACYPELFSILVYPHSYHAVEREAGPAGTITEAEEERLGEAWEHGTVVLSWDDVRRVAQDLNSRQNVVLHEFAHVLDQQDGDSDGTPPLKDRSDYLGWARVFSREYEALQDAADQGRPTLIDKYGATAPAEFFAVVTECFFQSPLKLRRRHPELYEELRMFYRQDPAGLVEDKKNV